jgi:hypothetical protein
MKLHIRSKPFLMGKVFLSTLLIMMTCSASAGHYVVSPGYYYVSPEYGSGCGCCDCYNPCTGTCEMFFSSPHRYNDSGSGQVAEYAWISDP